MSPTGVRRKVCILLLALPLLIVVTGCPFLLPTQVLAGTWAATVEGASLLDELLITFNAIGQVTNVTFRVAGGNQISVNAPVGTATVNGKNVTINTTFNGNGMTFNGTLNADDTVITGTITLNIVVGPVTVAINGGPATLTRLETD